ncbi:hypothetical protein AT6N2_C0294 [Agrobacterium tumefaciens]|nr:hypothetical protein AT6N2_C0294 [Agrobacterium tumefaciens]
MNVDPSPPAPRGSEPVRTFKPASSGTSPRITVEMFSIAPILLSPTSLPLDDIRHLLAQRIPAFVTHPVDVADDRTAILFDDVEMHLVHGRLHLSFVHTGPELEFGRHISHAILDRARRHGHILQRATILRIGHDIVTEGIALLAAFGLVGRLLGGFTVLRDELLAEEACQHVLVEYVFPVFRIAGPVLDGDVHHFLDGIGGSGCEGGVGKEDGGSEKQSFPHGLIPVEAQRRAKRFA